MKNKLVMCCLIAMLGGCVSVAKHKQGLAEATKAGQIQGQNEMKGFMLQSVANAPAEDFLKFWADARGAFGVQTSTQDYHNLSQVAQNKAIGVPSSKEIDALRKQLEDIEAKMRTK